MLQEFVASNCGFITFGMWVITGLCIPKLQVTFGPFSTDLIILTLTACTPTIWIANNSMIIQEIKNYFSKQGNNSNEENHNDPEDDWGGIWIGNQIRRLERTQIGKT